MHKKRYLRNLPAITLAVLLAACVAGIWSTREPAAGNQAAANESSIIDERLLATAHRLAAMADTAGEQAFARTAVHLADHELDQEFAIAIRTAASEAPPPASEQKRLAAAVSNLKTTIAAQKEHIAKLTEGDELDLAKAQLELSQDELEDAQQDLARAGGGRHARMVQALEEHEAAEHDAELPKTAIAGPANTLAEQLRRWIALRERQQELASARRDAAKKQDDMTREHDRRENRATGNRANLADVRRLADESKTLAEYDKSIQDSKQLVQVYSGWSALVEGRRRNTLHLLLQSLALIVAILLAVVLIDRAIRHAFRRQKDPRRLHQIRVLATVGVQVAGLLLILLVVFGPPNQITTLIGLLTAGLTVALKDFIAGFFGWFVLMGKNGIRIGDWVEINGVSGEVIEIGLLKTVLLEMGNWTSTGHPTGRQVSFVNSFALEGHYFNFSTAGQWLWDEVHVAVPLSDEPYRMAEQIRETVERLTEADVATAEREWERVTHQYGTRAFSPRPAVDVRPAVNGLNVVVRYITRGPQRFEVKSRIFESLVALLHRDPAKV